jgi:signal transduction histidine kinase
VFKLRIAHKGIILVAVPLLVGLILDSMFCWNLNQANSHILRELKLKDAMVTFVKARRSVGGTQVCTMAYLFSRDNYYKEKYAFFKKQATEENDRLKKMLKNEKGLQVPELQISGRAALVEGMSGMRGGQRVEKGMDTSRDPFYINLKKQCDDESALAIKAMNTIQNDMLLGLLISTLISASLVIFFNRNIRSRLLLILANTVSLSKGTPLNPPLKGNDEIAELDQFVYKSASEIRELERFKKEMIGIVSHELKSPLSSVGTFLSSFGAGVYGDISAKAKDKVDRTYNSVKRLMGLVSELLYLDRLELEMNAQQIAASEILAASIDTVKELSEKSGIEIVVDNHAEQVYADRNRIVQVVINLVSNAMKFSPANGKVTIETKANDQWFECRVSDQGRGIPESFRKTIFEPFKQVDATDATTKKGTGLGLTISKSIVEQHGGTIGVDS